MLGGEGGWWHSETGIQLQLQKLELLQKLKQKPQPV
jgi:hypothetical protein